MSDRTCRRDARRLKNEVPWPGMPRVWETAIFTALAMVAFASNSLLTRMALANRQIDAASFALVRIGAGALVLAILVTVRARVRVRARDRAMKPLRRASLAGPLALFAYVAPFSYAYLRIGAALGALVLFGTVQTTMIVSGVVRGERPGPWTWLGLAVAIVGLASLTLPSALRPDLLGIALMIAAGIAWGFYSLLGRIAGDPLEANARNFLWSAPLALLLSIINFRHASVTSRGIALAVVSGAVTSAVGYALWYRALRGLSATRAAVVQLSVPVVAAFGAVFLLGEAPSTRLILCGMAILGGVALALVERAPRPSTGIDPRK
jgi:drug/metabolite transporter (DMT)-like permease